MTNVSVSPAIMLTRRLAAIDSEVNQHKGAIAALSAEAEEIKTALKVLQRYGVPVTETAPRVAAKGVGQRPGTLPDMILTVVDEMAYLDGPTAADLLEAIRTRWDPKVDANTVRPTTWRMVKDRRLVKVNDRYQRFDEKAADEKSVRDASAALSQPEAQGREAGSGGGT